MERFQYILFDLDGTLTDPAVGITNSIMYALKKYNIKVNDRSELYKFIGPPLLESFMKYYGFTEEEGKKAIEYYREYFGVKGLFENIIYDGIKDLLKSLKDNGKILLVATSKPQVFAEQILVHFKLDKYFSFIAGSNLDGTRIKKAEVIEYALEGLNITELTKTIMVGDREHDIRGAKTIGIKSIGVLYGYGSKEELVNADADYIVQSVSEIKDIVL
ncbi:MAG: HAD family hydrolase [Clostridiaceae bacterium]|jgi:phosphoglycolate phosphatase|nr:HAD family hydrolase [Clostridiaceae bacterium]